MKKIVIALFALLILPLNCCLFAEGEVDVQYSDGIISIPFGKTEKYANVYVKRVIDGDTILLQSGERVRLLGIDTPEMHESSKLHRDSRKSGQDLATIKKLGRRSYEFVRKLIESKRVSLEFDVEKRDQYGRLLAYVFLKDGTFVNAKIVEEGYASLMTYPPNVKYANSLLKLYRQARKEKRGLWK
ncbi:thermonuclease family protein [Candidatus Omnitrophota bacterium]